VFVTHTWWNSSAPGLSSRSMVALVPKSSVRRKSALPFSTSTVQRTGTVEVPASRAGTLVAR
jgi:hypothetical protein